MMMRQVRISAILIFFGFVGFPGGCRKQAPPQTQSIRPVKLMTVDSGDSQAIRRYPGTVRASKKVDLSFRVSGRLVQLPIQEGLQVQADALLAQVDPRDFQTSLSDAQGGLARAQASRELAQPEFQRVQRIRDRDPGAISAALVDQKAAVVSQVLAEITSHEAAVKAAKDQLQDTELRAPFTGLVARVYVDNFQEIREKDPILSLQDVGTVEILVDLPEVEINRAGQEVGRLACMFAAAPNQKFDLELKEYQTEADPQTQTFRVVLRMPAPKEIVVLPGMTVTVLSERGNGTGHKEMMVPATAVGSDEKGASCVWIVDSQGTARRRGVQTGVPVGEEGISILAGLKAGETIVVSGIGQLQEGMAVRPLEP